MGIEFTINTRVWSEKWGIIRYKLKISFLLQNLSILQSFLIVLKEDRLASQLWASLFSL